jgi:hypothetical protein
MENEDNCRITYIYGLYEVGKEDEIRYIGKSDNIQKRIRDHRNDKRMTSHKCCWIKSVINRGGEIGILPIKVVPNDKWKEYEIFFIKEYRNKYDLVNNTDGGDGSMTNIYFKSYDECKEYIKINKPKWVGSIKNYKKWSKIEGFPKFLPKAPNRVFDDWISWGDYLSTNKIRSIDRKNFYLSYNDAVKYIKNNFNLKSSTDYRKCRQIPTTIPKKPYNVYKEWIGWEEFLGYKSKSRKKGLTYLDYEDSKSWILDNYGKLTTSKFRELSKNNELPIFIHKKPERYYGKIFSWSDYLDTARKNKSYYLPFDEARDIVLKLKLKSNREWRIWCKTRRDINLDTIPSNPDKIYKTDWIDWYNWLGYIK